MDKKSDAVERIDAGEDAWNEDDEVVEVQIARPLDKVVPIRISSSAWSELRREARELGIGPSTLARMWILERLHRVPAARR